jgi:hypothetical protein
MKNPRFIVLLFELLLNVKVRDIAESVLSSLLNCLIFGIKFNEDNFYIAIFSMGFYYELF